MERLYREGIDKMNRPPIKNPSLFVRSTLILSFWTLLLILILAGQSIVYAQPGGTGGGRSCQSCHAEATFGKEFARSIHGRNGCTSCHPDIANIASHASGQARPAPVNCARCHRDIAVKYRKDVHAVKLNFACQDCHGDVHVIRKTEKNFKVAVAENCTRCHSQGDYVLLGHGRAIAKGSQDSATCTDCHGLHNTPYYNFTQERDVAAAREAYTRRCWACHADVKIAKRNNLTTAAATTYHQTYHGKVMDIGYSQRAAGCPDCHSGHNNLSEKDPRSALHPDNLYNACKACHKRIHKRFADYNPHPDPDDNRGQAALYWADFFMIVLLTGTFLFFWVHTILWWRRVYLDKCLERKLGFVEKEFFPECRNEKQIQRFSINERIMHVLLILSFFTLVMTGFPLKYHDTAWAKVLVNIWGGVYKAGIFHRVAALVLCGLFFYTLWLSIKYLFPKGQYQGWLSRLFSPDSLCPNLKDLQDIKGMFLWFFGKGEMPRLDRWTYWEKFDFLAVFWGMTAIGGSGFILWFPELFSYIMPGWVINIATIVHSEEAFLAAVFIFTVHFFNNHLVPNKFPLEPNIFTGRYRLEALREERPLEYERLVAEGRLESLQKEGPGVWTQLFASVFGLGSLLLGLFLLLLIFWAAIFS
jgi:cytochrome b subunit of formate dehydrogenase